ncbi:MAG TPA: acetyltransferase, partial [Bacteroidales bacterium]|nr:acetyltransferase [Bacteroidales bacterium]
MGTKLLFWLIFYPLSILPLKILYGITYFVNLINRAFINYRKEVIDKNLSLSFPEKNQKELRKIRTRFYKHLAEIVAEMIKMLTI